MGSSNDTVVCGSAVILRLEHRSVDRGSWDSSPPPAVLKLGQFRSPTLPVHFGRDSKSWSPTPGVYAWESKKTTHMEMEKTVVDSVPHT